jgi:hypothetical protein
MTNRKTPTAPIDLDKSDDFRPWLPNDDDRPDLNERVDQPEIEWAEPVEHRDFDRGDY